MAPAPPALTGLAQSPGPSSRLARDLAQSGRNSNDDATQSVSGGEEEEEEEEEESTKIGSLKEADELRKKPASFSFSPSPSAQAINPDVSVVKASSSKSEGDAIGSRGEKEKIDYSSKGRLGSGKISKSSFDDSGEFQSAAKTRVLQQMKIIKLGIRRAAITTATEQRRRLGLAQADSTRRERFKSALM